MTRDEIFDKLRTGANKTSDFRLAVRLLTVIAGVTKDRADIISALVKARSAKHDAVVAESLAIIVKILAHAGRFCEARAIVGNRIKCISGEMARLDPYWHAQAAIYLSRFSGDKEDTEEAEVLIGNIRNPELRDEARADLAGREQHIHLPTNPYMALAMIAQALNDDEAPHHSASLHAHVDAIVANIFVKHLG